MSGSPHSIEDVNEIKDVGSLLARAKWLEGKTLEEISASIKDSDSTPRKFAKGDVGYVIEEGFFGIKKNSKAAADIAHLGVEIKTCPLKYNRTRDKLTVKEPLSLNIINYHEEAKNNDITESALYKKNKKILFVFYIHDSTRERSEYLVKYVFLWSMDEHLDELRPDYDRMVSLIRAGQAHPRFFGQKKNRYLRLSNCPKHGGTFSTPGDIYSRVSQPYSTEPAEIRAFRFRNEYVVGIVSSQIGIPLMKGGPRSRAALYWVA